MRKLHALMIVTVTLGTIGCGEKNKPAEPANLTPEQIAAANQEQKLVDEQEKTKQKADSSSQKGSGDSVNEEERRARGR